MYVICPGTSAYAIAPCRLGHTNSRAVIDSGAVPNLIHLSHYRFLCETVPKGTFPMHTSAAMLKGVVGAPVAVEGKVTLPCTLGPETRHIEFLVVDERKLRLPAGLDVLFGVLWLHEYDIAVNFGNGRLHKGDRYLLTCEGLATKDGVYSILPTTDETTPDVQEREGGHSRLTTSPEPHAQNSEEEELGEAVNLKVDKQIVPPDHVAMVWASAESDLNQVGKTVLVQGRALALGVTILDTVVTPEANRIPITIANRSEDHFHIPARIQVRVESSEEDRCWPVPEMSATARNNTLCVMGLVVEAKACPADEEGSDPLHHELNTFDPATSEDQLPAYDDERFERLLEELRHTEWKLTGRQKKKALKILREKQAAFNLVGERLGRTHLLEHDIEVESEGPIFERPRFVPMKARPAVEKEIESLLRHGHIRVSTSAWNAPIVIVKRKDGRCRLCVDYRRLNRHSKFAWFPLPRIESILYETAAKSVFSTLDLRSGYHQVPMARSAIEKTAFSTHQGHYEWTHLPFGLSGAPATFQRLMSTVLNGLLGDGVSVFLDDVAVHTHTVDEHLDALQEVLNRLVVAGLQASPEKTHLFQGEVQLLGHTVGKGVVRPSTDKTQAIRDFPVPTDLKGVQAWLGLSGFYRRFIRDYAKIARPLTTLLKKEVPFVWGVEQEEAFRTLKEKLASSPILQAPDFSKDWHLYTDASGQAIGSVLTQEVEIDGKVRRLPVAYYSRTLRGAEERYPAVEQEALAIIESLKKFRPLVYSARVIVWSDNKALSWLFERAHDRNSRIARWTLSLQEANAEVRYIPGKENVIADTLSRAPGDRLSSVKFSTTNTESSPSTGMDGLDERAVAFLEQLSLSGVELVGVIEKEQQVSEVSAVQADTPQPLDCWTPEDLKRYQAEDPLYGPVVRYLLTGDQSDLNRVNGLLRKDVGTYFLDHGILYKRQHPKDAPLRTFEEVIVVPEVLRTAVIRAEHADPLSGHGAEERTIWRIRRKFTWRGMYKDVRNFIRSCIVCLKFKGRQHPLTHLGRYPVPSRKFSSVAVDLVGPLPLTESGHRFILTAVDYSTRYVLVSALKTKAAVEVADAIWDSVIRNWGCPEVLISDQGSEFRNQVLKRLAALAGFRQHHTTIYHAASNGLVERSNAQVLSVLRGLVDDAPASWDRHLGTTQIALNTAYHSSLGDTPYFCVYGDDPITPNAAFSNLSPRYNADERAAFTYRIYQRVKENLERAAKNREDRRSRTAVATELSINQRVFVRRQKKKGESKLAPLWRGPYRVVKKEKDNVYTLRELMTGKTTRVHLENMKICPEASISHRDAPTAREVYPQQRGPSVQQMDEAAVDSSSDEEEVASQVPPSPQSPAVPRFPVVDLSNENMPEMDVRGETSPSRTLPDQTRRSSESSDSTGRSSTSLDRSRHSETGDPLMSESPPDNDLTPPEPKSPDTYTHTPTQTTHASSNSQVANDEREVDADERESESGQPNLHADAAPPRRSSRSTVKGPGFYKGMMTRWGGGQ